MNEEREGSAGNKVIHTKKSVKDSMDQFNTYHTEADPGFSKSGMVHGNGTCLGGSRRGGSGNSIFGPV